MKPWEMVRRFGQPASGGGGGDPYWSNVVSLLNFPGAYGSTSIIDAKGKTWTAYGDAQIDTSLGYNAGLFDGNDLISTPSHADIDFGSEPFTVEMWLRPAILSGFQNILRKSIGTDYAPISIALDGNKLRTRCSENGAYWRFDVTSTISLAVDTLTHVAACRDVDSSYYQYVGGIKSGPDAGFSAAVMTNTSALCLGATSSEAAGYSGHIAGMRITKGVCRYPGGASFIPPPAPFPES